MKTKQVSTFVTALGISTVAIFSLVNPVKAGILWDENIDPDLSNNRLIPTQLPNLVPGDNLLKIILDNPQSPPASLPSERDLDYFIITVPEKTILKQLFLVEYDPNIISDDVAFIGMQQGTTFTEPAQPGSIYDPAPGTPNPANLFGYALIGRKTTYGPNANCNNVGGQNLNGTNLPPGAVVQVGEDLLPILGNNLNRPDTIQPNNCLTFPPPIGFTAPLTAGNYVFWTQQTVVGDTPLTFNFVAATVPESKSILGLIAFVSLGFTLRKKIF